MTSERSTYRKPGRVGRDPVPNRFERTHIEADLAQLDADEAVDDLQRAVPTQLLPDSARSIIRENDSPDIPFRYSVNIYRGCEHGCAYCYARPTHETLGLDAGLDFESKILVKHEAPHLLRADLSHPSWRGEPIMMSGVTDSYQPAERRLGLTRACLQAMLESRQPVGIITKNVLILRDLDIIAEMGARGLAQVMISVTSLDASLAHTMEPRTATPAARLRTVRELVKAGVPTGVMVAPVVPGLTDQEVPAILSAAAEAGAATAAYQLLRLPLSVAPVFFDWLARELPLKHDRIKAIIRSTRQGRINDAQFGRRMRGTGPYAAQIARTFRIFRQKHGLDQPLPSLDSSQFRPPQPASGQMRLF